MVNFSNITSIKSVGNYMKIERYKYRRNKHEVEFYYSFENGKLRTVQVFRKQKFIRKAVMGIALNNFSLGLILIRIYTYL